MPPRKKARTDDYTPRVTRSGARRALAAAASGPEQGVQNSPQSPSNPGAEKPGNAQKVVRVRRGSLQQLPEVAIEIQNMIFSDLRPRDLFNLSRTCRRFRDHFLNRNTEPLWKAAMENALDLPKRPPWLSIPAFVHLLYAHFCHNCGAPNIRKIQVGTFTRLCSACIQEQTVWYAQAFDTMLTKQERASWNIGPSFYFHDMHKYIPILERSSDTKDPTKNRLLKENVMLFVEGFRAAAKGPNQDRLRKAIMAVYETIREDYAARLPYANDIRHWMEEQNDDRKLDLETARKQRFELIMARVLENGWEKELAFLGEEGIKTMSKLPVVRQSSKLTEGAWKKVFTVLDGFLNNARAKRLDVEMKAALRLRMDVLAEAITSHYLKVPRTPLMDCCPNAVDFAFVPECRAILDRPTSQVVTAADFTPILPALAAKWDSDRREELIKYLRPHLGKIAGDVDPLTLAIAVFEHGKGWRGDPSMCMLRYPAVLDHKCEHGSFHERQATRDELIQADVYTRGVLTLRWTSIDVMNLRAGKMRRDPTVQVPFRVDHLFQYKKDARIVTPVALMRKIVAALGLDPARATFDDLQKHDGALRCATCEEAKPNDKILALMWGAAYMHARTIHYGSHPKWYRADEKDMKKVRARLDSLKSSLGHVLWACTLCTTFVGDADIIPEHLSEDHEVQDCEKAIRDGTIYVLPGCERSYLGGKTIMLRKSVKDKAG
ncbi:hypothetical protein C8Q78DRAFT_332361 [Trametes maxima]|nr:hypothetical protein C8Q78DRAFT_332361 [Trametes maxima]